MIGRPVAIIQVPTKRGYSVRDAAEYLGKSLNTIRKMADLGILKCKSEPDSGGRLHRIFFIEDLNAYLDALEDWCDSGPGEEPGRSRKEGENGHL